jgi:hypothetical protein
VLHQGRFVFDVITLQPSFDLVPLTLKLLDGCFEISLGLVLRCLIGSMCHLVECFLEEGDTLLDQFQNTVDIGLKTQAGRVVSVEADTSDHQKKHIVLLLQTWSFRWAMLRDECDSGVAWLSE